MGFGIGTGFGWPGTSGTGVGVGVGVGIGFEGVPGVGPGLGSPGLGVVGGSCGGGVGTVGIGESGGTSTFVAAFFFFLGAHPLVDVTTKANNNNDSNFIRTPQQQGLQMSKVWTEHFGHYIKNYTVLHNSQKADCNFCSKLRH